jgi:hypothetical protein
MDLVSRFLYGVGDKVVSDGGHWLVNKIDKQETTTVYFYNREV